MHSAWIIIHDEVNEFIYYIINELDKNKTSNKIRRENEYVSNDNHTVPLKYAIKLHYLHSTIFSFHFLFFLALLPRFICTLFFFHRLFLNFLVS